MNTKVKQMIDIEDKLHNIADSLTGLGMLTIKADIEASKLTALIDLIRDKLEEAIDDLSAAKTAQNDTL